ncbi:MAG: DsbA family protein [Alphaproteobacteria bacterium]|nr:DsbA family protein [Alphaproteobacteria bacterium]
MKAIVFGAAKKAGLDVDQLKKDMENPAVEEEIIRTRELATKLGIQGTPAFIIGDQFFRGFIEAPAMRDAINQSK